MKKICDKYIYMSQEHDINTKAVASQLEKTTTTLANKPNILCAQ